MTELKNDQIDYKNKIKPIPVPSRMKDIDLDDILSNDIMYNSEQGTFDINSLNKFINIPQSRENVYSLLDMMSQDPTISVALDIYAADASEPNDKGQIIWVEANDAKILGMVTYILESMNVDKNAYSWIHALVKYGDCYLRLYRNSEFNVDPLKKSNSLNEDVVLKQYDSNDHYALFMEQIKNPSNIFDLILKGKTVGYIQTNTLPKMDKDNVNTFLANYNYRVNTQDTNIYKPTEFVHACLEDNSSRSTEEISVTNDRENSTITYQVKRGQSILYNAFKIWRELQLLENSVILNRITKSAIFKIVQVDVGDMENTESRNLLRRIKTMMEQKSAISADQNIENYTNPGPMENILYFANHGERGKISVETLGGDAEQGTLTDLDYFKNKLFTAIGIPKQFLGDTEDAAGFSGGESLALLSSRYAKTIKRIQNAIIQAVTDAVNLILYDKGLTNYINEFTIKMQTPLTKEEKERKEAVTTSLSNIQTTMSILSDAGVENPKTKLAIVKSMLSEVINNGEVNAILQEVIDNQEKQINETGSSEEFNNFNSELPSFENEESTPMEEAPEVEEPEEEPESVPMETTETEEPKENFYNGSGEQLNEEDFLPSFEDLGISYTDIKH